METSGLFLCNQSFTASFSLSHFVTKSELSSQVQQLS